MEDPADKHLNQKIGFNKIATLNGIIDFNDPTKLVYKEFGPKEYVLKQINVMTYHRYIDEKVESPHYSQIMNFLTNNNKELEDYILDLIANACIWHKNTIKTCVILLGDGDNGKSTFLHMLNAFFGNWNASYSRIENLNKKEQREKLCYAMINIRHDCSDDKWWKNLDNLRKIISGETINAKAKFQTLFSFKPTVKIFLSSNELQQSRDKEQSIQKIFSIIPCNNKFDKNKWCRNKEYDSEFFNKEYGIKETLLTKLIPRIHRLTHVKKIPNIVSRETQKYNYSN